MTITGILWMRTIVDKLAWKHNVTTDEVEEMLQNTPMFLFVEKGERRDEDVYMALGRTEAGRYLTTLFIYKPTQEALILSARDMAAKERKYYAKKR